MKRSLRAAIGAASGLVIGTAVTPLDYLAMMTAPITYPLSGAVVEAVRAHTKGTSVVKAAIFGSAVGAAVATTVPLSLLTAWATIPVYTAGIGGCIGWFKGD